MNKKLVLAFAALMLVAPVSADIFPDFEDQSVWTKVDLQASDDSLGVMATDGERMAAVYRNGTTQMIFAIQDSADSTSFTKYQIANGSTFNNGNIAFGYLGEDSWGVVFVNATATDVIFARTNDNGVSWNSTTIFSTTGSTAPVTTGSLLTSDAGALTYGSVSSNIVVYSFDEGSTWTATTCNLSITTGGGTHSFYGAGTSRNQAEPSNFTWLAIGRGSASPLTNFVASTVSTGDTCVAALDGTPGAEVDYTWRIQDGIAVANQQYVWQVRNAFVVSQCGTTPSTQHIYLVSAPAIDDPPIGEELTDNLEAARTILNTDCKAGQPVSASWDGRNELVTYQNDTGVLSIMVGSSFAEYHLPFVQANDQNGAIASGTVGIFERNSTNNKNYIWVSTSIIEENINEPPDFGEGLDEFISSIGFKTQESRFFFSIILIGLTTVSIGVISKFMSPGRNKLILVSSAAMLVGIFCVLLGFFDFWMLVASIVLATVILNGAKEFRSTFLEIKSGIGKIRESRSIEGDEDEVEEAVMDSGASVSVEEVEDDVSDSTDSVDSDPDIEEEAPESESTEDAED